MTSSSEKSTEIAKSPIPKRADSLQDLPSGDVLTEEWMGIDSTLRSDFLVYAPDNIQERSQKRRVVILVTERARADLSTKLFHIHRTVNRRYPVKGTVLVTQDVIERLYENAADTLAEKHGSGDAHQSRYHKKFETMVGYAMSNSVSDIHIERRSTVSMIRMRKHGQLLPYEELSNREANAFCSVIYNAIASEKSVVFRAHTDFQKAAVDTSVLGEDVKLRYQSTPAYPGGFDVVLRVLPIGSDEEKITPLADLGYTASQATGIFKIASKPTGSLIIAGETGSGKSTTIKNLLMHINQARHFRCKIFTIEDPCEYKIPHVTQIPVPELTDDQQRNGVSPFAEPIRACMRADPDIMMIGEVRDNFTADALKKATQSGHQVLTTVHATSALGIIERLIDFGVPPNALGSPKFINGMIWQHLVPSLCPHCSTPLRDILESSRVTTAHLELAERLEHVADLDKHDIRLRNEKGCEHCKGMGIIGRTVCAEIIVPDFRLLDYFRANDPLGAEKYWRSLSDRDPDSSDMTGKTALEHALYKMRQGLVCPMDIEESIDPVDAAWHFWNQIEDDQIRHATSSDTD